jgi:hypothetical protein
MLPKPTMTILPGKRTCLRWSAIATRSGSFDASTLAGGQPPRTLFGAADIVNSGQPWQPGFSGKKKTRPEGRALIAPGEPA